MERWSKTVIRLHGSLVSAGLLLMAAAGCLAKQSDDFPHLFIYDEGELTAIASKVGMAGSGLKVRRNGAGSALHIAWQHSSNKMKETAVVRDSRRIEVVRWPARVFYLNDAGEVVIWYDTLRSVHFKSGETIEVPLNGAFDVAPGAEFFFIETEPGVTEIRRTAAPTSVLVRIGFRAEKIFAREGEVYLFARRYAGAPVPGEQRQDGVICRSFRVGDGAFVALGEMLIRRPAASTSPFGVIDMDPWSNRVLLEDVVDPPFSFLSAQYVFDPGTQQLQKLGRASGHAVFLEKDLLRPLLGAE